MLHEVRCINMQGEGLQKDSVPYGLQEVLPPGVWMAPAYTLSLIHIYHTTTWEGIVALDDDMIIHVAPASAGTPVPELTKAFLVPKGCMVKINAAIWHLCPLPVNNDVLHAMIILPECTYANDCTVVEFEEKDWFKIV